ncbi:hypothetical protein DXG01_012712 [Tephrocybe rancida]|nr:hypothetical protein DXG01_012712 [Tephrocybe rancida]
MSTGLLTGIVAILELTTFATLGFNFVHVFLSIAMGANSRRIVRASRTDPSDTLGLDNLRTSRDRSGTLNIMFKENKEVKSDMVGSFPSTTTKFSDLHVHPKVEDLNEVSGGSVSEHA